MKRKLNFVLLSPAVLWIYSAILAQPKKPVPNDLRWLSGCWISTDTLRQYEELWMKPAGNSVLGMGRTVANGKTVAYEFLRIQQQENGDLYYVASPSGQPRESFKLTQSGGTEWVFENLLRDFPQKVIYSLKGDSLIPRIEGKNKGKNVRWIFQ